MGAIDRIFRGRRGGQDRPLAAQVAALFANGEQGLWYDPSDLSTMYQDASGSLPAYMPGQGQVDPPVGLLLDKRKGLLRGPERLINPDFSAGATGWSVSGTDATHIATFAGGTCRYQSDTTSPQLNVLQAVLTVGAWYEVTVVVSAWTSGALKTDAFSPANVLLATGVGTFKFRVLAISNTFNFTRSTTNVDITIDSISVRELAGNHAYQATTTSRPTLSARYNLLTNTENLADTSWGKPASGSTNPVVGAYVQDPFGGMRAQTVTFGAIAAASQYSQIFQPVSTVSTAAYSATVFVRATTASDIGKVIYFYTQQGATFTPAPITLTASYQQVTISRAFSSGSSATIVLSTLGSTYGGANTPSFSVDVFGFDLRVANDGFGLPPYQRVADANTYDTTGFPLYLRFDGVDDFLQTASVDFSPLPRMNVWAVFRKLSDASAFAVLAELSSSINSNPGSFALYAPGSTTAGTVAPGLKGTTAQSWGDVTGLVAPLTLVASCAFDLSGASRAQQIALRLNGFTAALSGGTDTAAIGGSFGNYPLYIGRRGGTSLPFNGRLYGLLIRAGAANDSQFGRVEKYINQKAKVF